MSSRSRLAQVASETMSILERGSYTGPAGAAVSIRAGCDAARDGSILYTPDDFDAARRRRDEILLACAGRPPIAFEVTGETTLGASRRLVRDEPGARVLALNFASARNPGGGFLNGARAQEESLARASALHPCLDANRAMYEANRGFPSCLYTDHMIYAPDVPVFRDDEDRLLDQPFAVSILTAPAVNAGAVRANEPGAAGRIAPLMRERIEKVLSLAVVHGHDVLVLGAWGCGVFANDPAQVAGLFAEHLAGGGAFRAAFRKVVFAVYDRTPGGSTIAPFRRLFAPPA